MLFTFPSRYSSTIGRQGVFSLGRWSCRLPAGFPVSRGTRDPSRREQAFGYRALTSSGGPFQTSSPSLSFSHSMRDVPQPRKASASRFGLLRVRSPLLTESRLFSSPPGTKMFQFPGLPRTRLPAGRARAPHARVPPFGHPRINACLRLPEAFRRSPRPSSAPGA